MTTVPVILNTRSFPGNSRLEDLKILVASKSATSDETEEFNITSQLYARESMGEKPWRDPDLVDLYDRARILRTTNTALRGIGFFQHAEILEKIIRIEEGLKDLNKPDTGHGD